MSKAVNEKWKKTFPDTIGNQNRPAEGVDDTQPFETGAFPQYMANDPVRYDLQNAAMSQSMSNDARLKEMVDARGKELDDHKVDPGAHKTGIAGNAATATKVVTNAASGASANIAEASMASSDSARIRVSGANNAGELALETADDGNEAIVARQYTGYFKDVARTAAILDANGNTSFPGTVVAPKFTGALNGNATTASKLASPRTISLTGKAAGSTSFDGSANATINVTSVNADTASRLSTARKINITGNATGAAAFDGSGDVSINVTVNESKHAAAATALYIVTYRPSDANTQYGDGNMRHYVATSNMTKNKPPTGDGHIIDLAWDNNSGFDAQLYVNNTTGRLNMRGQDGGKWSNWLIGLDSGNFNDYAPTKTGTGASGSWNINSATATKLQTPRTISLTGNASGSANFDGSGNVSINTSVSNSAHAEKAKVLDGFTNTDTGTWGKAPGTIIGGMNETGGGAIQWRATGTRLYEQIDGTYWQRDGTYEVIDTSTVNNYAPTNTGSGASGTWPISISGNAATATTATSATTAATCTGNSATASKLATARSIALTGNATGSANFDGSGNISISTNVNTATNADTVDGYHASDLISKIQDITPKTAAAIGQFRELVVNDSHQIKLPDGGTWAYFVYCYTSWSGDNSNDEHRTRTGAGIAAGGTVLHTDDSINSSTINNYHLNGTTSAGGADGNAMIVGGFCWRIA